MSFLYKTVSSLRKEGAFCAFCNHPTQEIIDYGEVALAGAFLKPEDFEHEKKYLLSLHFCEKCYIVQVPNQVPKETLFNEYFYFSSATETMRNHFNKYAKDIVERFNPSRILEIGCNDGVLLKPLADLGVEVIGVDPSNTAKLDDERITVINDFFSSKLKIEKVDMVLANNVFAHIEDIHDVTQAIYDVLTDDGVFVFEVNGLDSLISGLQYDWVYHEHLYYYSLLSLEKHFSNYGLEIFDLLRLSNHGGSIRYFVCKSGMCEKTKAVKKQRDLERWMGLDKFERFERFAKDVKSHSDSMKFTGKLAGYGACGRTNTLLQFTGIKVDYIVDDSPHKQGFYTPGTHIPIVSRETLFTNPPDSIIVFAWSFLDEISQKTGDFELIVPLPNIYKIQRKAA